MIFTALLAMLATTGMAETDELSDLRVIAAMQLAWLQSKNGLAGDEAGFRLDGTRSGYKVVAAPPTNEYLQQRMSIIPGVTFAVFHVHPARLDPAPSKQDKASADQYGVRIFTIHAMGLFMYDPTTRATVKLRNRLEWMKPVEKP